MAQETGLDIHDVSTDKLFELNREINRELSSRIGKTSVSLLKEWEMGRPTRKVEYVFNQYRYPDHENMTALCVLVLVEGNHVEVFKAEMDHCYKVGKKIKEQVASDAVKNSVLFTTPKKQRRRERFSQDIEVYPNPQLGCSLM